MNSFFTKILLASYFGIFLLSSCTKESSDNFIAYPNNEQNDTVWTNNPSAHISLNIATNSSTIIDSFFCNKDTTLKYGDSVKISFPANAISNSTGGLVTGKVKMELTILHKKGEFICSVKPSTNFNSLLEAGNYVDIKLTQNDKEIIWNPAASIKINVKEDAPIGDMKFFAGNYTKFYSDSLFNWQLSTEGTVGLWKDTTNNIIKNIGYIYNTKRLRWFGSMYYTDSMQSKTRLNVVMPINYTNKNTAVFAVLKNKKTVINLSTDSQRKIFFAYNIPINTELVIVSISIINNNFYLGSKDVKVISPDIFVVKPEKKDANDIVTFLKQL